MTARLLDYENEQRVVQDGLRVLNLQEKKTGFDEFKLVCSLPVNACEPVGGRFIVELDDGRKGTVILIGISSSYPIIVTLDGEGILE